MDRKTDSERKSWQNSFKLQFEGVPTEDQALELLFDLESRVGQKIRRKRVIASLIVEFFKGKQDLLDHEFNRYGEKLNDFKVPPIVLVEKSNMFMAAYDNRENLVLLDFNNLKYASALNQDEEFTSEFYDTGEVVDKATPREIYRNAGREEFDHALDRYLNPGRQEKNNMNSLAEYDALSQEYRALGMQVLLGSKNGESGTNLDLKRSRLKSALPFIKKKKTRD